MPDPKKQNKKNKAAKPLKRGDRRPDGSIVGGIAPAKPAQKPLGKKSVNDSPETEARRIKEYKIAKAANEASNKKAKEKAEASKAYAATKNPIKNLGTVSDGTPFYKRGPLYAHGPDGTHPTDPTKEAKAKAEAKKKAEANASKGKKVYGKTTRTKTTSDTGVTTHTISTPYTTSGSGNATTKKSYKQLAAEGGDVEAAKKFNASATSSGVKTRSYKTFDVKPVGIKPFVPPKPTADITIPKVPKKSKPPMPTFSMSKGRSGGGTTKLIDFNNNRVKKTKSRSGNSCGCS
jgi:hypothetical protein